MHGFEELQFISVTLDWLGAIIQLNCWSVTGKDFYRPQEGVNAPWEAKHDKYILDYASFMQALHIVLAIWINFH